MSTHHPSFGRSSGGLGSVFRSFTKSLKTSSSSSHVPVQINPTVVGGGEDLQRLIQQVQSNSLSTRATAAAKLIDSIQKYAISSIPEVWYLVRDLCDGTKVTNSNYRSIGIKLMIACIKGSDNSVGTRLMFFRDIVKYCRFGETLDPEYLLFLDALSVLTKDGKDIHDFCIYDEKKSLNVFLESCMAAQRTTLRAIDHGKPNPKALAAIVNTLDFVGNCFEHNLNILDTELIVNIKTIVVSLGFQTANHAVLLKILKVINSIVVYSSSSSRAGTIKLLTALYGLNLDPQINDMVWQTVDVLRSSDITSLILNLCDILQNPELQNFRSTASAELLGRTAINSCIGALELLFKVQLLTVIEGGEAYTDLESTGLYIISASRVCVSYNVPILHTAFLRSLARLFSKDSYFDSYGVTMDDSFDKLMPFQLWYSSTSSIYDVLNNLKPLSAQDKSYMASICASLQNLYENHEIITPKDKLVAFFLHNHQIITSDTIKFVLKYYAEEKMCSLLHPFWKDNCVKLLNFFYYNQDATIDTKIHCLMVLKEAFNINISVFSKDNISYDFLFEVLKRSFYEQDEMLIEYLIDNFFTFIAVLCDDAMFKQLCEVFKGFYIDANNEALVSGNGAATPKSESESMTLFTSLTPFTSLGQGSESAKSVASKIISSMFSVKLAKAMARIFLISSYGEGRKAQEAFNFMIIMCHFAIQYHQIDMLLILCKCMVRIRVDTNNSIYITQPTEMIGLSTSFKRNPEDASFNHELKDKYKWIYPESLLYLPEKYFDKPSRTLKLSTTVTTRSNDISIIETFDRSKGVYEIDISLWLDIALMIMEKFIDWEVYSFIWAHFCSQLSNIQLFYNYDAQITRLRTILCEQLTLELPKSFEIPVVKRESSQKGRNKDPKETYQVTKADLQVVLVRSVSALLAYHDKFSKYDEDQLISSLIFGLGSWEKTAIPCINILTVCCYELPLSIKKFLSVLLTKLQTRVSSAFASSHTLEFLLSLIHLPTLTSNFTIDEFKRVFGIAFKYIQYAKDLRARNSVMARASQGAQNSGIQQHGVDAQVELTPSTQSTEITPILSQYILVASFEVISSWFLKINMNDRKSISSFLIKNLIACGDSPTELDDQTIGFLDFIVRFTYSDVPLKIITHKTKSRTIDEESVLSRWIIGNSVIAIESSKVSGDSTLVIRRPTGTVNLEIKLNEERAVIDPNYLLLQLYDNLHIERNFNPIPIMEDSIVLRALNVLDRIPTVEFHKIGIVYIGKNQDTESQVLSNKVGSSIYEEFLEGIGSLVKLKNASQNIYVGGLDTDNNTDGEYTRYWRDKTTQIVYHITTMMNKGEDDQRTLEEQENCKKAHIGNNYVNIFFDESGLPYNFNLIKSQFNFLNVRISRHTMAATTATPKDKRQFFKVQTYRRSGVPGVFATCHFKIVSFEQLPVFIRNLAVVADQFATVWHTNGGESIWSQRVKQIKVLREKTLESHTALQEEASSATDTNHSVASASIQPEHGTELYSIAKFNSYTT